MIPEFHRLALRHTSYCEDVSKYKNLGEVRKGAFGEVFTAQNSRTKQMVVLKEILRDDIMEFFPIIELPEVNIVRKIKHHNIVRLIEICTKKEKDHPYVRFYMVSDFCEYKLSNLLNHSDFQPTFMRIKDILKQLLTGVSYIHSKKILHRDIRTDNILLTREGIVKLTDFSLATTACLNEQTSRYTNREVTLWYRPPELLLKMQYGLKVDLWSVGCVMAELYTKSPILQGNSEEKQLRLIVILCGSMTTTNWPDIKNSKEFVHLNLPKNMPSMIAERFALYLQCKSDIKLLESLLKPNPKRRISAADALRHGFFFDCPVFSDLKETLATLA